MIGQLTIDFSTGSKINKVKLSGQNEKVFRLLEQNKSVTLFDGLQIGVLHFHSRIADLRNKVGIIIHDRMIKRNGSCVKEYSLNPFNN